MQNWGSMHSLSSRSIPSQPDLSHSVGQPVSHSVTQSVSGSGSSQLFRGVKLVFSCDNCSSVPQWGHSQQFSHSVLLFWWSTSAYVWKLLQALLLEMFGLTYFFFFKKRMRLKWALWLVCRAPQRNHEKWGKLWSGCKATESLFCQQQQRRGAPQLLLH